MEKELLLEIGTEEVPAGYMGPALSQIKEMAQKYLTDADFTFSKIQTLGTPRRMVLVVESLGLEKAKLSLEGLAFGELKKILPKIITGISFPKSMRWGDGNLRFARPIRWICAIYDDKIIDFNIENLKSDNFSYGHRFLAPDKFEVKNFGQYQAELRKRFVIVDHKERKNLIKQKIGEAAQSVKGEVLSDDQLLETVNWLVEYPIILVGAFQKEFLEVPRECLITAMKAHQKYFGLIDEGGHLLPYFIVVSNTKTAEPEVIIKGNEKVLAARLSDARFLYNLDKKTPLFKRVDALKKVTFQEKLGTMYDKTQRLVKLSEFIANLVDAKTKTNVARTALLAKADLTTEMVSEFPELQGIMGRYYAELSKERPGVARGIGEHYLPRFAGDILPETKEGAIVGLADKIDTIAGYFGIGFIPTSTEDPYALRRQILGTLQIIWHTEFRLPFDILIEKSLSLYPQFRSRKKIKKQLFAFLKIRLENFLETKKYPKPLIDAVLALKIDDLSLVKKILEALSEYKNKKEFEQLKSALKRVNNILKGKISRAEVKNKLLREQTEKDLYKMVSETQKIFQRKIKEENYRDGLALLIQLAPFIHKFFDQVLVMAKEKKIRDNRLALLSMIYRMAQEITDFRKLV